MKWHWRTAHEFSPGQRRGGSGRLKKEDIDRQISQSCRRVRCQRFFVQKDHSQYFEVQSTPDTDRRGISGDQTQEVWSQVWERACAHYDEIRASDTIRPGEADEVNPWLRRTGWVPYLEGFSSRDILRLIEEPADDEAVLLSQVDESDADVFRERVAAVIWHAVADVARISQETVSQSGVMLRFESIRTEAHQNVHRPLDPYQSRDDIARQARYWQQIVIFLVRVRQEHNRQAPPFKFNRRQDQAYQRLMAAAEAVVTQGDESDPSDDSDASLADDSDAEHASTRRAPPPPRQTLTELQSACLSFCIQLLNQRIHNRESDMAMICALAALGVSPTGKGFRGPDTYPSILSAVIKVAHFIVVQRADQLGQWVDEAYSPGDSPWTGDDSGYESDGSRHSAQRRGLSSFDHVRQMMDAFMVRGCASPMQWMLDLRAYGMKIGMNTTSPGHVDWSNGGTLQYKSVKFSMAEFRGMVAQLHQATRRTLVEDLMFTPDADDIPAIPWPHLYDDPGNSEPGWCFLDDRRSQLPVDGHHWLFDRIRTRSDLSERFVRPGMSSGIDQERMRDWFRQVVAFRGKLLALMHMTGGQPARGPEILSIRHRNTVQGGHRNLFIEDGTVVFVTRYHKGYEVTGDVKIIHRYLPREVGELVVWYLWLVLPFVQRMQAMLWQQSTLSDHMWPSDPDGRKWTTERMKHEMQRASRAGLGQSINVADYRQIAVAIYRRWISKPVAGASDGGDEEDEGAADPLDHVADEQAAHSSSVAGAVYARETMELAGWMASRRQQFRSVSEKWQRFLGFPAGEQSIKSDLKRKRSPFEREAEEARTRRQLALRHMDANADLSWMMRKEVVMRSAQGEAMQAVQQGENSVVVVMPTGSGKSILFMLPAFVQSGGVTIVVVPLKSLRADMMDRCSAVNIGCAVWSRGQAVDGASIVLVTPEKALSPEFGTFVGRLRQTQRLDRIVIDECHIVLNDRWDFRQGLQQLGRLAYAETQMLLLTATLPPSEEQTLFDRMYWRRDEARLIRASTVRPNIAYSVVDGPEESPPRIALLAGIVEEVLRDPEQPEGKVVVMCESKAGIRAIGESGLFPCEPFHADMTDERKDEVLQEFRAGGIRTIVASSSFNMGIDIADIRLVVHMDEPRNLLEYGQGSGRAGRDGLASRSIIVRGGLRFGDDRVKQYLDRHRSQCRRIDIDRYLDGNDARERCQADELQCDRCQQQSEAAKVAAVKIKEEAREERAVVASQTRQRTVPQSRRTMEVRREAAWEEMLTQRLDAWKGVCVPCRSRGYSSMHSITKCPQEHSRMAEAERRVLQRSIKYPGNMVCYRCGVSKVICQRWSADGRVPASEFDRCQFFGVLIGVVVGIKHAYPPVWGRLVQQMERRGVVVRPIEELVRFLGQEAEGSPGYTELVHTFMWLTERVGSSTCVEQGEG
ncbi:hypothetical protein KC332_g17517 [Hortaea werneckii]|nr:hypothetical protein KC329_g17882 [Hortaea werneckii]KAI7007733.1 hypothetical protein KC366_g17922 [Hortaea werneckii]KAI7251404.1 hypothetical protein KC335_g16409 [Hortaea werneckii]KAI7286593.1 hypothetical protein KC340_g18195 [Hortaea werneckii]KAI7371265.1 hypothetical protein KC328_g17571 [Hortaea werneckii]